MGATRVKGVGPVARRVNRLKFSAKLQPKFFRTRRLHARRSSSSFQHGRGLLHLIKAGVYSYVHSILPSLPRRRTPSPQLVPLSSYRHASAALFAYYRRAACRQQAIEIPLVHLYPLAFTPALPLPVPYVRPKGETCIPSDKNFNTCAPNFRPLILVTK